MYEKQKRETRKGVPTWTSETTYIDIDTGEMITKHKYNKEYYHIKTEIETIINKNKSHGHKKYTKIGRKKPEQGKLF